VENLIFVYLLNQFEFHFFIFLCEENGSKVVKDVKMERERILLSSKENQNFSSYHVVNHITAMTAIQRCGLKDVS
jgi:AraC-like DNA-binding protein